MKRLNVREIVKVIKVPKRKNKPGPPADQVWIPKGIGGGQLYLSHATDSRPIPDGMFRSGCVPDDELYPEDEDYGTEWVWFVESIPPKARKKRTKHAR